MKLRHNTVIFFITIFPDNTCMNHTRSIMNQRLVKVENTLLMKLTTYCVLTELNRQDRQTGRTKKNNLRQNADKLYGT